MKVLFNNPEQQTIVTAGGLGDMLIVLCKLNKLYISEGKTFKIMRYDIHVGYDALIENLINSAPFAKYDGPSQIFKDIDELNLAISNAPFPYVDTKWCRTGQETYDFNYSAMDPFPEFNLIRPTIDKSKINIGIQLCCGLEGLNFRGFKPKWLYKLRSHLPAEKFNMMLFGKNAKTYDLTEISAHCANLEILNFVNKLSFEKWMGYISTLDLVISLEGFSALFAMSQKVPTFLYNQYPHGVDNSVHPLWAKNSTVTNINTNIVARKLRKIFNKNNLYSPSMPKCFGKVITYD